NIGGTTFIFGYVSNADDADIDAVFAALGTLLAGGIPNLSGINLPELAGLDFRLVFGLGVEQDGDYEFRLFDQLDHANADDPCTAVNEDDQIVIAFSGLFEARDGDGDAIALPSGSFTVIVNDDVPSAGVTLREGAEVRLDESV